MKKTKHYFPAIRRVVSGFLGALLFLGVVSSLAVASSSLFPTAVPLLAGGTVSGALVDYDVVSLGGGSSKADVYSLSLVTGQSVTIDMSSAFDTYLYLFDTFGNVLAYDDDGGSGYNSQIVYTATQGGEVFIEATSYDSSSRGAYYLEVAGQAVLIPPQAQISIPNDPASLSASGNLITGTSYIFTDLSLDLDGVITDRCWNFGDGSGIICQTLTTISHTFVNSGSYQVGLTVTDNDFLSASVNRAVLVEPPVNSGAQPITIPNSISGELTIADQYSSARSSSFVDTYSVQLNQGDEITIDLQASFDTYLYLKDAFNTILRQNDDGGSGYNSRIVYQAPTDQTIVIEATSYASGALGTYTLDITNSVVPVTLLNIDAWPNPLDNNNYTFLARFPAVSGFLTPTFYSWDFGDGTVVSGSQTVSHTYVPGSDYSIVLSAFDAAMQPLYTGSVDITPGGASLAASFTSDVSSGVAPLDVTFTDTTTGVTSGTSVSRLWDFGDGSSSTAVNPSHTYVTTGVYQASLQVHDSNTFQSSEYVQEITVSSSSTSTVPVTGTVRLRPQVLMAGFDPMLIDLADSSFKAFAVVRPGAVALQYVTLGTNQGAFSIAMSHVGTWQNGDQYYEGVYTFPRGSFASMDLPDLFGDQPGEFNFTAVDVAQQSHSFPNLEFGNHVSITTGVTSPYVASSTTPGARKLLPQVLGVGFDPILSDLTDSSFDVFALVREGVVALQSVSLTQNQSTFQMAMTYDRDIDNGDKIYKLTFTYPRGSMAAGIMGALFGDQSGEFNVTATDNASQTHSFPVVSFGNYPDI